MKYQLWLLLLSLLLFLPTDVESAEDSIVITISSDGEAKITQNLNPRSTVSGISVPAISDKISKILATDGNGIILQTIQKGNSISIATLGATEVNLSYDAKIISKNLNIWNLSYNADREITVVLPPLSSIVSVNNIPIDIDDKAVTMPPGHISLSYTIRQVSSQNFDVSKEGKNYQIQIITGSKIADFEYRNNEIHFGVDEKAPILVIVPKLLVPNPLDVSLNDNQVEFKPYYENSTSSWLRIDPYQSGNIKISKVSTTELQGGGCLIATAAFGSEFAPQVQQLREVRDNAVLKTESGAAFMAGFNQFYYSFSPTIADWERENPVFKQFVKLAISPLLTTLSILNYFEIDSEEEMLGFGIAIILLNIAIYFLVPFVTIVTISNYIKSRSRRTCCSNRSNHLFKSIKFHKKSVKSRLIVALALAFVLVSMPSAFAQEPPDPPEHPIEIVLNQSLDQVDAARETGEDATADRLYNLGLTEYNDALTLLEADDIEGATEHALVAMALFEDALVILGPAEGDEILVLDQLPPGFGSGVGSASDQGLEQGQGLGVGGIPSGILKQIDAGAIFDLTLSITNSETEANNLKNLISDNSLDTSLNGYDGSINLAKELLANGDVPSAQAQLDLANEIIDGLYGEIKEASADINDEQLKEFADNTIADLESTIEAATNIPLSKFVIANLQEILDTLKSGDYNEILVATSEGANLDLAILVLPDQVLPHPPGFEAAGENPNEQGLENGLGIGLGNNPPPFEINQNGNGENGDENGDFASQLPGFGQAGANPSLQASGQGVGLGNTPPGLEGLLPPGLQMQQEDYIYDYGFSPDDEFEPPLSKFEDSTEDNFEPGASAITKAAAAKAAGIAKGEAASEGKSQANKEPPAGPPSGPPGPPSGPPGPP